jgi:hypothetical protein
MPAKLIERPCSLWIALSGAFLLLLAAFQAQPASSQGDPTLTVTGTGGSVVQGGEVTYRIQLLNWTYEIVYDGLISHTLPAGFSYVPGSSQVNIDGWPISGDDPAINGQTLSWGPFNMPSAGYQVNNPYGIHTMMHACNPGPGVHVEGAWILAGNGGYVKQLFYPIDTSTTGPSECAVNFVRETYARSMIPILRLEGHFTGIWQAPDPGPDGDYSEIAQAYASFVAGLPRRDTLPLYIEVWNEPDLWIEWSNAPNANQYGRFFVAVSNAIRALGDPRIRILNAGLTPANTSFASALMQVPGFANAFDVWASHCYPQNHPANYNRHNGTARYPRDAIDCYLAELDVLRAYGRSDARVILTEAGYELGNNVYGFEGYPAINEDNRASYIASAFADYWSQWPEVVAVTPFELADSSGHWANFDWVYPVLPLTPHRQYEVVRDLPKPQGDVLPQGFDVTFRARVDAAVLPGIYYSTLWGTSENMSTPVLTDAAPVTVIDIASLDKKAYLPLVMKGAVGGGEMGAASERSGDGGLVPTHFLKDAPLAALSASAAADRYVSLAAEPRAVAVSPGGGRVYVSLANGQLAVVDSDTGDVGYLAVGPNPQAVAAGESGRVYVVTEGGLALVDTARGQVLSRVSGLERPRSVAWDAAAGRVYVADAGAEALAVFDGGLSARLATLPLGEMPDGLALDVKARRLFVSMPGARRVVSLNAAALSQEAQAVLEGGPLLALALDAGRGRLYGLSAIAPGYRAISVWETGRLERVALVAGSVQRPLESALAMAVGEGGVLFVSERAGLWQVSPADFSVTGPPGYALAPPGGLAASPVDGLLYLLDAENHRLLIHEPHP